MTSGQSGEKKKDRGRVFVLVFPGCSGYNDEDFMRRPPGTSLQRENRKDIYDMERRFFTSESVTEGHPDKICDQISDAILDELIRQDPNSRVACETSVTTGLVVVMGEISTEGYVDIQKVVRETVREIGYDRAKYGFDCDTCGVMVAIDEQSADIAMGVNKALEARENTMSDQELEAIGAGDQGLMFGYATTETPELIDLSYHMMQILAAGYIAMEVTQCLSGIMRGAGDTVTPMWIAIINTVIVRVPLAYGLVALSKTPELPQGNCAMMYVSLLITWIIGATITFVLYRTGKWKRKANIVGA